MSTFHLKGISVKWNRKNFPQLIGNLTLVSKIGQSFRSVVRYCIPSTEHGSSILKRFSDKPVILVSVKTRKDDGVCEVIPFCPKKFQWEELFHLLPHRNDWIFHNSKGKCSMTLAKQNTIKLLLHSLITI